MKKSLMRLLMIIISLLQLQYVIADVPRPQSEIKQQSDDIHPPSTGIAPEKPAFIPSSNPLDAQPTLVKDALTVIVSETDAEKIAKAIEMAQIYWKEYKTPAASPISEKVEYELATLVAEKLATMTPEKYAELLKKYHIEHIDLSPEIIKDKLMKDVEFRKEIAERISCVLYPVFRSFGWQSEADEKTYDSVQKYRERLEIQRMIPLPAPLATYRDTLKKVVMYSFFNEKGIIRLQDDGELMQADFTAGVGTAKFLRDLFPNSWSNILADSKMTQLGQILSQMQNVEWETDYGKETWSETFFSKYNERMDKIREKMRNNKQLIDAQFRKHEQADQDLQLAVQAKRLKNDLKPYALDPLYEHFFRMKNRKHALESLQKRAHHVQEFIQKLGLKEVKDPILAKLTYELAEQYSKNKDSSKNLINNIKKLTDKNAQYHIASDSEVGVEKKLYEALFDVHGVYKLILQTDQFVENLHLSPAINRKQNVSMRRYLNLFIVLRNRDMDTRYQPLIEEGLKVIPQALGAKGRVLKKYEDLFERLYNVVDRHHSTSCAKSILRGLKNVQQNKK